MKGHVSEYHYQIHSFVYVLFIYNKRKLCVFLREMSFCQHFNILFSPAVCCFYHQVALGCKQASEETRVAHAAIRQHLTRLSPSVILSSDWPLLLAFLSAFYIFLVSCLLPVSLACRWSASGSALSVHPSAFTSCLAQLFLHLCHGLRAVTVLRVSRLKLNVFWCDLTKDNTLYCVLKLLITLNF